MRIWLFLFFHTCVTNNLVIVCLLLLQIQEYFDDPVLPMEDIPMEGCCPIEDYPFEDEGEMEDEGEEPIGKIANALKI